MSLKAKLQESSERSLGEIIRAKYILPLIKTEGLVLDVGPGVTPKGDINVDISKEALMNARCPCPNSVVADATALPFKDGVFSIVISSDLIEHVENDDAALAEMRRVGSKLVLHTPNKDQTHIIHVKGTITLRTQAGEQIISWGAEQEDHKRLGYSSAGLYSKIMAAGFKQAKILPTFNILECIAWELDRFIIFQILKHRGIKGLEEETYPINRDHMYRLIHFLAAFDPVKYVNLGWLVEAE